MGIFDLIIQWKNGSPAERIDTVKRISDQFKLLELYSAEKDPDIRLGIRARISDPNIYWRILGRPDRIMDLEKYIRENSSTIDDHSAALSLTRVFSDLVRKNLGFSLEGYLCLNLGMPFLPMDNLFSFFKLFLDWYTNSTERPSLKNDIIERVVISWKPGAGNEVLSVRQVIDFGVAKTVAVIMKRPGDLVRGEKTGETSYPDDGSDILPARFWACPKCGMLHSLESTPSKEQESVKCGGCGETLKTSLILDGRFDSAINPLTCPLCTQPLGLSELLPGKCNMCRKV